MINWTCDWQPTIASCVRNSCVLRIWSNPFKRPWLQTITSSPKLLLEKEFVFSVKTSGPWGELPMPSPRPEDLNESLVWSGKSLRHGVLLFEELSPGVRFGRRKLKLYGTHLVNSTLQHYGIVVEYYPTHRIPFTTSTKLNINGCYTEMLNAKC